LSPCGSSSLSASTTKADADQAHYKKIFHDNDIFYIITISIFFLKKREIFVKNRSE